MIASASLLKRRPWKGTACNCSANDGDPSHPLKMLTDYSGRFPVRKPKTMPFTAKITDLKQLWNWRLERANYLTAFYRPSPQIRRAPLTS